MIKVITVSSICGRTGTSLVINLLGASGCDIGDVSPVTGPNNEKGYFEVNEINDYFIETIPGLKGFAPMIHNTGHAIHVCYQERIKFRKLFKKHFTGDCVAIKTPYCLPVFMFGDKFDVYRVMLTRNHESQAKSIAKMNSEQIDWVGWLTTWKRKISKFFMPDIEIDFDEWFTNPYETYLRLYEATKPPVKLTESEVLEIIDFKLKHQ